MTIAMRLSAKTLQQIIGHPVARFSGSGHKRALGRVAVESVATLFPLHGDLLDDPIAVTLRDISAETVGLTSPGAMMPYSSLILSIAIGGDEGKPINLRCRVTRCSRLRDGRFNIAAQFLGICQLQHLISQMKTPR